MGKPKKRKIRVAAVPDLQRYMQENGISQTQLAEQLEVTQGLVWQWLNGKTPISPKKAKSLEKITGIPRMRLLYPEERAA